MNLAPEFVANCKNTIVKAIIKPFRLADKTTALNQIVTAYNNHTISQTPDISFENVKMLGGVSGVALDLLFMDSNLKVKDKRGIFDEYLQRRINVVKAYLQNMNLAPEFVANCKNTIVKAIIKPFRLADKTTALNQIVTAYNNHTISERTAVTQTAQTLGTGVNVEEELDQIHEQLDNIDQTDLMVGGI
jgi:type III secretion system FlhB-like substrate exporter